MAQTVKVRLRKPTQVFDFLVKDITLAPGDGCVVRSDRGLEYGICTMPPEDCPPEEEKNFPMSIVRKATHNDESTFRQILAEEEKAKALCSGKIEQRRLPMRLVDVEYTFDRHKVVFYFTADERVDFRELVRDLAHELKTRIELRHIQVRDKAKIVGGISSCGRELCCATWMAEFMPISMKMAKRQNLSLNPSKISGQCGRLMCCLSYENHNYSDRKKKKPTTAETADAAADAALEGVSEAAELEMVPQPRACRARCRTVPGDGIEHEDDLPQNAADWEDAPAANDDAAEMSPEDAAIAEEAENEALLAEDDGADDVEERTECGETVCVVDPESGEVIVNEASGQNEQTPRRKSRRRRRRRHHNRDGGQKPTA